MHLAINATEIGRQRGGNESHLLGLLQGLRSQMQDLEVTLVVSDDGAQHPSVIQGPWQVINVGEYRRAPFLLWQQTRLLLRLRPDWYLSTYFLPPLLPCRGAVIVHDLSFRAHPDYFPPSIALYMRLLTGLAVRQAERVLLDSEYTRQELAHFHPEGVAKGAIIWNGVGEGFTTEDSAGVDEAVLAEYGIQRPYLLAIGNIHPRKNLARLLEAYERLKRELDQPPAMVWVGLPRWGSNELIGRAEAAGVLLPGYVPQAHLPTLYRQARAFAYPSLYEGFGLPVVEAMACGTPVLGSNTTSVPEVAGEAALLVDPESVPALTEGLRRLCVDPALRADLRERGLAQAARFTWERTARLVLEALGHV